MLQLGRVAKMKDNFTPEIAIIMRDDELIEKFKLKRTTINTSYGPVHRCYYGFIHNVPVLIVYGRFNGEKGPSFTINHQQTIEAIKNSGAKKVVGTFVVGGIKPKFEQGTVYVVDDFIGMGNYKIDWNYNSPFHNAEMIQPVCPDLTAQLIAASKNKPFKVVEKATYVCFNGYPRIETRAELNFYNTIGGHCVGQTLDPEATICRLNGLCYGAICVQIDSPSSRTNYANSLDGKNAVNPYNKSIKECRVNTSSIILDFLKNYKNNKCEVCGNLKRKNNSFKQFPLSFYE